MRRIPITVYIILFFCTMIVNLGSCYKQVDKNQQEITIPSESHKKRILYVNSYDLDFPWVQGILRGMTDTLEIVMATEESPDTSKSLYEFQMFHMKSKKNSSEDSIQKAAVAALDLIDEWKPDLIITSDDNAAKYLVVPYLQESEIPIIFCGINWDASDYGFPTEYITGMVEVHLIDKMVMELQKYSRGERIGYIRDDSVTARKESKHYEELLGQPLQKKYPRNFGQWKRDFLSLQSEVDIILVGYPNALEDWDGDAEPYRTFLRDNTIIPTGSWDEWTKDWVLMSIALYAEEQGEYAASTAIRVLNGESPGDIPLVRNQRAKVLLNMGMAKKLDIVFPMDLIERSHLVENWFDD